MNYYHYGLILFLIVLSFLIFSYLSAPGKNVSTNKAPTISDLVNLKKIKVKGIEYEVEIADTFAARQKGLMYIESMPENHGMFFVFEQTGFHSFWMKNTLIPLDMIWLNKNGEVVYIYENAQPCSNFIQAVCSSIIPNKMGQYVLELNAGQVKKLNLAIKDKISF